MIEAKESLIGNINSKQDLSGNINVGEIVIPPTLQEKTATPTTSSQTITYDENYNGLSSVTVNPIPQEYIIPSGEYNVTTNGTYNISQYASVNVTTNEADLNWNSLGYSATPDFIKEYYDYAVTIKNNFTPAENLKQKYNNDKNLYVMPLVDTSIATNTASMFNNCANLQAVPKLIIENSTNMSYMFAGCTNLKYIDLSSFKTTQVTNYMNLFQGDTKLLEANLSSFTSLSNAQMYGMFSNCTSLMKIDMRNFDFTILSSYNMIFGANSSNGIPDNCLIIVKDTAQKTWFGEKYSRLTNVRTVAEYEQ